MAPESPPVPSEQLAAAGWRRIDHRSESLFRLPGLNVFGETWIYEDATLRRRIAAEGGPDRLWRFFFATELRFEPSLGPGGAAMVRPIVVRGARESFADELRERGIDDVERTETGTLRTEGGHRARTAGYRGRLRVDEVELPIAGWVAVWNDGSFRVAGGAYPESGIERWIGTDREFRTELFSLIRATG